KELILFQVHGPDNLDNLRACLRDFPEQQAVGMFRQPIRGLSSMLANWQQEHRQLQPEFGLKDLLQQGWYIKAYKHMLIGWQYAETLFQAPVYLVSLEALHQQPEATLKALCQHLSLQWHPVLLQSTADGKPFQQHSG